MKRSDVKEAIKLDRKLVTLEKELDEVTALMNEGVTPVRVMIGTGNLHGWAGGPITFPADRAGAVHAEITAELCRQREEIITSMTALGVAPPEAVE